MYNPSIPDSKIPVRRLQLTHSTGKLTPCPKSELFLKGPVPLNWLNKAATLSGKTLNVGIALWWQHGMSNGKPFKLTRKSLQSLCIERDASSDALRRLEQAGLISVERNPGQRPTVWILPLVTELLNE